MTLLVQLSDPHVSAAPGDTVAADGLATAVRAVSALDPAPDAVLVSGDVAADRRPEEYARARELLGALSAPMHALPGDHDESAALRAAFGLPGAGAEPIRYAVDCGALRLILCDTTQPGRDDGRLDADALAWLETTLADASGAPTVVAMHHSPLPTGIAAMDAIGLPAEDRAELGALLARCSGAVALPWSGRARACWPASPR